MALHRSLYVMPLPTNEWRLAPVVNQAIRLPDQAIAFLSWLSMRWEIPVSSVVADLLILMTGGRFLLTQLADHGLLPEQSISVPNTDYLDLRLPKPLQTALNQKASIEGIATNAYAGRIVLRHLLGNFNTHLVSLSAHDQDIQLVDKDSESLKVWLPDSLDSKLSVISEAHSLTKSDVIRNTMLLHVYGRIRFEQWTSESAWRPKRKATKFDNDAYVLGEVRFSRKRNVQTDLSAIQLPKKPPRSDFIQTHGKSLEAIRVFAPPLLIQRLQHLSDLQRMPISEYCRRSLTTLL